MGKSLTPLIIVVAVVVVLTIIIINSDVGSRKPTMVFQPTQAPRVELSSHRKESNKFHVSVVKPRSTDAVLLDLDKHLSTARRLLASGQVNAAENELRTILVFHPDNMRALTLLGGILFYSHRYADAELIFRRQIRIAPKDHQVYNKLGAALAKQKKFKEAIDNASIAVGMNPDSGEAQINLAGMYAAVGDKKKALEHLRMAVKLLGKAVLPLTEDSVFDALRNMPEFQVIISNAAKRFQSAGNEKPNQAPKSSKSAK